MIGRVRGRARRAEDHHEADRDQRRDRREDPRVGRGERAAVARVRRGDGTGATSALACMLDAATAAAKASPRASAEVNMSNDAQPGESSTTSPRFGDRRAPCATASSIEPAQRDLRALDGLARSRARPRRSARRPWCATRRPSPSRRSRCPSACRRRSARSAGRTSAARRSPRRDWSPSSRRRRGCRRARRPSRGGGAAA